VHLTFARWFGASTKEGGAIWRNT